MFRWDPPTGWLGATIKWQAKKAEAPKGASVNHCWLIETDDDGENMVVELRKDGYGVGLKWCAERPWRKAAAVWASLKRSTARTLDDACAQLDVKVLVALREPRQFRWCRPLDAQVRRLAHGPPRVSRYTCFADAGRRVRLSRNAGERQAADR